MATTDDYMDISSGDEDDSTVDYGLLRAVENCGADRFFDFDQSTREQYRRLARAQLMEEGRSVKAAQVNAQAREWWLSDGWGTQ
jgi:hypothetical protein